MAKKETLKIVATKCIARDLEAGDLFSTVGPEYWDHFAERQGIGEKVYIRTDVDALNADDADLLVYRITIQKDGGISQEWSEADCATSDEIRAVIDILSSEGVGVIVEHPERRIRLRYLVVVLKNKTTMHFNMIDEQWGADVCGPSGDLVDTVVTDVPSACHDPARIAKAIVAALNEYDWKADA